MNDDRWIQEVLEKFRQEIVNLGETAKRQFGANGKTQLSNLEQAALHAETFAEVEMFVKRQVGLAKEKERQAWKTFGDKVLGLLEQLRKAAEKNVSGPGEVDRRAEMVRQRVPEKLLGTAMRWIHSEYLYQLAGGGGRR